MSTCKACGKRTIRVATGAGLLIHVSAGMSDAGNIVIEGPEDKPIARIVERGRGQFEEHECSEPKQEHWSDK
jgi:hypothetical protein